MSANTQIGCLTLPQKAPFQPSRHRLACGKIHLPGYNERTVDRDDIFMMISVPDAWDSYRPDELHRQLEPAYTVKRLLINLVGTRHLADTLLSELLELRNHREHRWLEAPLIVVNWPFVRNCWSSPASSGFSEFSIRLSCPRASYSCRYRLQHNPFRVIVSRLPLYTSVIDLPPAPKV